ncbi:uncharacterized protein NP_0396A [Natronomonas pharaonis DSM 2160]|uniref:Uncharacterized protein n=1 Tax=Natronomonas pharaonis (strain ATCC 35678 / DSM 2160 / CIP 103997 / JCM 8858 / NBRC 14720 / NCIMB 2260 / Gabara) TaxID=348780 RepID=A0A1U7ETN8_NATPD|nr:DUF5810 domain-containing protein [Natronomonas pharaonis]CAI48289.1 uncharacterized protein NP_0396A [Natronomonas pharaonis DSM 2160]
MGYVCPVCSDPQADASHLANHLAFTAMLGDDDHEAWLDDNVPNWSSMGESELASVIEDGAESAAFPQVFEDTAGALGENEEPAEERSGALFDDEHDHGHSHGHDHDHDHDSASPTPTVDTSGQLDAEAAEILEEAREMTKELLDDDENA